MEALGKSVSDPASEEKIADALLGFTEAVGSDSGKGRFLYSPAVPVSLKKAFIDAEFPDMPQILKNCLFLIIDNKRESLFAKLHEEWIYYIKIKYRRLSVCVVTCGGISEENRNGIMKLISHLYRDSVFEVYYETDPSIIGGFILRIGNTVYDYSVHGSLTRMRNYMMNASV